MAATRTPGITIAADGDFFIDKRYRGIRIGMRVGRRHPGASRAAPAARNRARRLRSGAPSARAPAFRRLRGALPGAVAGARSLEAIRIHVRLLLPHIGHLEPHQVHDATLAPFIAQRIAAGASATTINRSLEVVRTILQPRRALVSRRRRPPMAGRAAAADHDAAGVAGARPTRSPGTNRIACSPGCRRTCSAWRCSPSTPGCATATSAACSGAGKCRCPRSAAASSSSPPRPSRPSATTS